VNDVEQAKDLAAPPPHGGQGRRGEVRRAPAFGLQEGVRHGDEHGVMRPAAIAAALEVIKAELVFQFPILLFNRPATVREGHQSAATRRRRD